MRLRGNKVMNTNALIQQANFSLGEFGVYPTADWNKVANGLRKNRMGREAGLKI